MIISYLSLIISRYENTLKIMRMEELRQKNGFNCWISLTIIEKSITANKCKVKILRIRECRDR
jgi:hypothetical protein